MARRSLLVSLVSLTALAALAAACGGEIAGTNAAEEGEGSVRDTSGGGGGNSGLVLDHGGPVLDASNTYAIYWGTQTDFPADLQSGMESLLEGFTGSTYLQIAGQYMRGAPLTTAFKGSFVDTSAPPKSAPTTAALASEVCKLFPSPDPNGIYVVFTSNAPKINYCAWHNHASCNGVGFEVAYVPNQALLPNCSPYTKSNLGCNTYSAGTVTAADSVAHEFMESISDPLINAWLDKSKAEIGDKCNYVYSGCVTLGNQTSWQIQSIWSNAIDSCQQQ
jgi:hypothetical protein